jgi:hypothetical protein
MSMWLVVFRSTHVVAFRTTMKKFAEEWLQENDLDDEGRSLGLFKIIRGSK